MFPAKIFNSSIQNQKKKLLFSSQIQMQTEIKHSCSYLSMAPSLHGTERDNDLAV